MKETYVLRIERRENELAVTEAKLPTDAIGCTMLAVLLYKLGEHLDPALQDKLTQTSEIMDLSEWDGGSAQ